MILRVVFLLAALLVDVPSSGGKEIGPDVPWCQAIHSLAPGEELVLRPGEYQGPCSIRRGGTPAAPVVIRAKEVQHPSRIVYRGRDSNLLNVYADHVIIRGLQFDRTLPNVDAIRIYTGNDVAVEDCRFIEIEGNSIAATHASVKRLTIRRNQILQSKATAFYLGCHNGITCTVSELLIEQNYIYGVRAPDPEIGYGIRLKLNSVATIRDNVIMDTKRPGIMIYGSTHPEKISLVERNFLAKSRTSSGIVIGGGPAVVRNNIVVGSNEVGIGLENYGGRGLLRGIVVAHNTVYGNEKEGILAPREGKVEAIIATNAVRARPGTPAFPPGRMGLRIAGNVDCARVGCFMDPDQRDVSPLAFPPGISFRDTWMPSDDFFGHRRSAAPIPGAIERLDPSRWVSSPWSPKAIGNIRASIPHP